MAGRQVYWANILGKNRVPIRVLLICGIVMFGLAASLNGCSSEEIQSVSLQEDRLASPGNRPFVTGFVWSESGDELLAFSSSGYVDNGAGVQEEEGTILWKTKDFGDTWVPLARLPEVVPDNYEAVEGAVYPDGSFVFGTAYMLAMSSSASEEALPHLYYVDSEGKASYLEGVRDLSSDANGLHILGFATQGRILLDVASADLGQERAAGDRICLYDVEADKPITECSSKNLTYVIGCTAYDSSSFVLYGEGGVARFDAETGKELPLESSFLEFYAEQWGRSDYNLLLFSRGSRIYCATLSGISCYDIEAKSVEEVLKFDNLMFDGGMCNFSSGAIGPDGSCLLACWGQKFYLDRICPSESLGTVAPEEELVVYTLEDNKIVSQMLALYQREHSNVKCRVEVGCEDASVTKEDAIKSLNARLLAGDGPDLLILDQLPIASYIEKGLLVDLSPLIDGDLLYENIACAYASDGRVCAVPLQFRLFGMMLSEDGSIFPSNTDNLESLLLRTASQGSYSEYVEIDAMAPGSSKFSDTIAFVYEFSKDDIFGEDGVAADSLSSYYDFARQLYIAMGEPGCNVSAASPVQLSRSGFDALLYASKEPVVGCVAGGIDYAFPLQIAKDYGMVWGLIPIGGAPRCQPDTVVGVCAGSTNKDEAMNLAGFLLSDEEALVQSIGQDFRGIPVSKGASKAVLSGEFFKEEGEETHVCFVGMDGKSYDLFLAKEEEIEALSIQIESASCVMSSDAAIKEIVMGNLQRYLGGDLTLDEAVAASKQRIELYLAE